MKVEAERRGLLFSRLFAKGLVITAIRMAEKDLERINEMELWSNDSAGEDGESTALDSSFFD